MNIQQVCMICHQKNDTMKVHKLRQMLSMCHQRIKAEPDRDHEIHMQWAVNNRCKYGIPCQKLKDYGDNGNGKILKK